MILFLLSCLELFSSFHPTVCVNGFIHSIFKVLDHILEFFGSPCLVLELYFISRSIPAGLLSSRGDILFWLLVIFFFCMLVPRLPGWDGDFRC